MMRSFLVLVALLLAGCTAPVLRYSISPSVDSLDLGIPGFCGTPHLDGKKDGASVDVTITLRCTPPAEGTY